MQSVIDFVTAHLGLFGAVAVAVLDLVFALNPATATSGVLHWIYVKLSGKEPALPAPKP